MVNILDPHEGESVYDPACGTGGMLLDGIHHVRSGMVMTAHFGENSSVRRRT
jgi:ubiquinone/menaquinone biosynthesis C-methylase UbiE